jgi:hypothetical protein
MLQKECEFRFEWYCLNEILNEFFILEKDDEGSFNKVVDEVVRNRLDDTISSVEETEDPGRYY